MAELNKGQTAETITSPNQTPKITENGCKLIPETTFKRGYNE
ncbi:hypothetical protein [Lacticaseibacillus paracasei]